MSCKQVCYTMCLIYDQEINMIQKCRQLELDMFLLNICCLIHVFELGNFLLNICCLIHFFQYFTFLLRFFHIFYYSVYIFCYFVLHISWTLQQVS